MFKHSIQANHLAATLDNFTVLTLQKHYVDFTLKRRGNGRFHVVSLWNPRGVFAGKQPL